MKRDIRLSFFYPHAPERLWFALTEPQPSAARAMEARGFEPRLGAKFQFRAKPQGTWNGIVDCVVTECDPPWRLAYTWIGGNAKGHANEYSRTTVAWTLEPEGDGTRLYLQQTGFLGMKGGCCASFLLAQGWRAMLRRKLAPVLEASSGAP